MYGGVGSASSPVVSSMSPWRRWARKSSSFSKSGPSRSRRRHSTRRPSIGPKRIRVASTAGLLDNRNIAVVGVEDVQEIPARPGEYPAQLIRRHHRVVHPRADDVTKTHAYADLTRYPAARDVAFSVAPMPWCVGAAATLDIARFDNDAGVVASHPVQPAEQLFRLCRGAEETKVVSEENDRVERAK